MKIVIINAIYGSRSTGVIVRDLCTTAEKTGWEVVPVYHHGHNTPSNAIKAGNSIDEKLHALYTRVFGKQAYASRITTKKLLRKLDKERPDIIHLHNLHSNFVNLNMLLKYLAKRDIATVITMHDCWYFTGKCFHYVESNCHKWQTGCGNCPRNREDIPSLFFDNSAMVWKDKKEYLSAIPRLIVVGCSKWICGEVRKSFLSNREIRCIYNGVDTEVFKPNSRNFRKEYNLVNNFIILGMAGKWLLKENVQIFEQVLASLKENDRLVLVGCNFDEKERFKNNKSIICLGYIESAEELAGVYCAADVFVNLTLADTLPTVNMEASACGTPVITVDVGGSTELVQNGINGYILKSRSYDELNKCIESVRQGLISRETCREYAEKNFDKNKNYQEYIKLYNDIMNGVKENGQGIV